MKTESQTTNRQNGNEVTHRLHCMVLTLAGLRALLDTIGVTCTDHWDLQRHALSQLRATTFVTQHQQRSTTKAYTLAEQHENWVSFAFSLLLESNATWTIPLSLGQLLHPHTANVIPLDLALPNGYECEYVIQTKSDMKMNRKQTGVHQWNKGGVTYIRIVACDHITIADLVAEAVCRFIRIHRQF